MGEQPDAVAPRQIELPELAGRQLRPGLRDQHIRPVRIIQLEQRALDDRPQRVARHGRRVDVPDRRQVLAETGLLIVRQLLAQHVGALAQRER